MAHTVAFKLNKPAQLINAGDSTGFGIRGGVKFYNRKTKTEDWTNYSAVIFSKNPAQIDFLQGNLIEGAVVTVSGETIAVDVYNGQNGQTITLALNNARIDYIASPPVVRAPDAAQQAYRSAVAPQQNNADRQQPQQQQAPAGFDSFDDDIPF